MPKHLRSVLLDASYPRLLLAGLLLCALSAAVLHLPLRYQPEAPPPALAEASDLSRWHLAREGASVSAGGLVTGRLEARGRGRLVYLFRDLRGIGEHEFLRVSAEVRGDGLEGPAIEGGAGQLVAISQDRRHRRVAHWPIRVVGVDGATDWQRASLVLPTAGQVAHLQLVAFVAADAGWLEVRDPRVEPVRERGAFVLVRYGLIVAWLALALVAGWRLLGPGRHRLLRLMLAGSGLLALTTALAPPPVVNDTFRTLLIGGQDVLHEVAALLREESAPGSGEARAGTSTGTVPSAAGAGEPGGQATGTAGEAGTADGATARQDGNGEAAAAQEEAARADARASAAEDEAPRQYWMPPPRNLDKRAHLAGFAALGLLAALAFRPRSPWTALPALALLALAIETLQGFTIMREPDRLDFAADLLGALAGVTLAWLALGLGRRLRPVAWTRVP